MNSQPTRTREPASPGYMSAMRDRRAAQSRAYRPELYPCCSFTVRGPTACAGPRATVDTQLLCAAWTAAMQSAADMLPLTSGAASCWLTVVALVLNCASNHSTDWLDDAMVLCTFVASALCPDGAALVSLKPDSVP